MKVYSNVDLVGRSDENIQFSYFLPTSQSFGKLSGMIEFLSEIRKGNFDAVLIFNANIFFIVSCFLMRLVSKKTKIVFFDLLLKKPKGKKQKAIAAVKRKMLNAVHCFFSVHKDLSDYENYYGISAARSRYIAFKANNYEIKEDYQLDDKGYILSCGVSHRDYKTLFSAVRGLNIKVKVVLPDAKNIKFHKSIIDFDSVPENVEIVRHDFNKNSWNIILSGAKFVVIPVAEDSIQPSGISVYLESMLFKKPVIISDGPSTRGLIDSGQALIVERGSAASMRDAICKLVESDEMISQYAMAGYNYAIALKGVDRLIDDMKAELIRLHTVTHS